MQIIPASSLTNTNASILSLVFPVSEVLKTLINAYKEIFKAPELTDTILLANYPQTIFVVDEVCKEGLPEHMDTSSIIKALSFKLPTFSTDGDKTKSLMSRFSSKEVKS
jgi:hypothetical protein